MLIFKHLTLKFVNKFLKKPSPVNYMTCAVSFISVLSTLALMNALPPDD